MNAALSTALFEDFRAIAYEKAGIKLRNGKEALVAARVAKRLRALGMVDAAQYLRYLSEGDSEEELVNFLDVISTNFTSFFREPDHFEFLTEFVKERIDSGSQRMRIWCAASSSGEEPYSIAITVLDAIDGRQIDFKLLATDISTRVLTQAKAAVYEEQKLRPVPKPMLRKYFTATRDRAVDGSRRLEVKPEIRKLITFTRLNLAAPPFPMNGPMDMVFCRNVMIYFDNRIRQGLIEEIERLLKPNGVLITGHSETLAGSKSTLKVIRPSIYEKQVWT